MDARLGQNGNRDISREVVADGETRHQGNRRFKTSKPVLTVIISAKQPEHKTQREEFRGNRRTAQQKAVAGHRVPAHERCVWPRELLRRGEKDGANNLDDLHHKHWTRTRAVGG